MNYYFCAHKGEARVYIQKLKLSQIDANIYANKDTVLTVTAMGKESVDKLRETFRRYPPSIDSVFINFGIAGCSDENIPKGTVFCVGTLHYNDETITLKNGVQCRSFTAVQSQKFDGFLCDMESFFLVKAALKHIKIENIYVYKVVSDHLKDAKIPTKQELNNWIEKVYEYETSHCNGS
jgi:succinylglutamate desuccinylase